MSTTLLNEPVSHTQTKPTTLTLFLGRVERLERLCHHLRRHSASGIGDIHHDVLSRHYLRTGAYVAVIEHRIGDLDCQFASLFHRVACIDGEIEQYTFQIVAIRQRAPQAASEHGLNFHRLAKA